MGLNGDEEEELPTDLHLTARKEEYARQPQSENYIKSGSINLQQSCSQVLQYKEDVSTIINMQITNLTEAGPA
jgi:hypothetical protein